jgi:hypothetical protein
MSSGRIRLPLLQVSAAVSLAMASVAIRGGQTGIVIPASPPPWLLPESPPWPRHGRAPLRNDGLVDGAVLMAAHRTAYDQERQLISSGPCMGYDALVITVHVSDLDGGMVHCWSQQLCQERWDPTQFCREGLRGI